MKFISRGLPTWPATLKPAGWKAVALGVVAEQEVRDRAAGETDVEAEVPREVGGQVPLQPPPAVVGAER